MIYVDEAATTGRRGEGCVCPLACSKRNEREEEDLAVRHTQRILIV